MINPDLPARGAGWLNPATAGVGSCLGMFGQGQPVRSRRRKTIPATCGLHRGPIGFANLLVSKRDGTIVLDPHVDGPCVIYLDPDGATQLCDTLTEWLG